MCEHVRIWISEFVYRYVSRSNSTFWSSSVWDELHIRFYSLPNANESPCVAFISHTRKKIEDTKKKHTPANSQQPLKIVARMMNNTVFGTFGCCPLLYSHGWHQFINECVNELDFSVRWSLLFSFCFAPILHFFFHVHSLHRTITFHYYRKSLVVVCFRSPFVVADAFVGNINCATDEEKGR